MGQLAARLGRGLLVVAFRSFGHQTFFNGLSGDPDIFHLSINDDLDPLKVGEESTFGDCSDMCSDATFLFRLTTSPNMTSFNGALTCYLTNSGHKACNVNEYPLVGTRGGEYRSKGGESSVKNKKMRYPRFCTTPQNPLSLARNSRSQLPAGERMM